MVSADISELKRRLDQTETGRRHGFSRELKKIQQLKSPEKKQQSLTQWVARVEASLQRVEQRRNSLPSLKFPPELPITQHRDKIIQLLQQSQVVIVAGETGSGKTTQLPKLCLAAGFGIKGLIGHTQPRRLAARSVAQRIADELESPLGEWAGYKIRFQDQLSDKTRIKLLTDGMLLAEMSADRYLNQYEVLIIDEAHERSLNIDFLLGYLTSLLAKRPELKLIITSATIDHERFSRYFNDAPIVEVSGRTYPVTVEYLSPERLPADTEPDEDSEPEELSLEQQVHQGLKRIIEIERTHPNPSRPGDVLVFLAGERDIRLVADYLRKQVGRLPGAGSLEILPLYSRLSNSEQNKVFQVLPGKRRVILATNVAETSITVPNIGYVIDSGLVRISRYSFRTKVQRLPIEPISKASANQRAGRCGRVAEGICLRLYDQAEFEDRGEFTEPEILRTNLASVILQMEGLRLGDPAKFPFIDPPDTRLLRDGYRLLEELEAIDRRRKLTPIGRQLLRFPLDPRLGRMLVAGNQLGCLHELLIIVSGLAVPEPWQRPHDRQGAADQALAGFQRERSDFLTYLETWQKVEANKANLSSNGYRKWLQQQFLSFLRVREWQDIFRQLKQVCGELGWQENHEPAPYPSVHQALLTGLLDQVALRDDKKGFQATRNRTFQIYPGSVVKPGQGKWIMAAEIVETSRVYGRVVAQIEPQWLEKFAAHLLKRNYNEPHWEKKSATVIAYEQSSLFGLIVNPRKPVHFGAIDPVKSREIFIQHALVLGEYNSRAPFFVHNQRLIQELEYLEKKTRRRDILVDDAALYAVFDNLIPATVVNGASFEAWRKTAEQADAKCLFLTEEQLLLSDQDFQAAQQFPDQMPVPAGKLTINYDFEPGKVHDGITIDVPLAVVNQVNVAKLEWLVPGLEQEKCIALIKSLPKSLRKQFVPVPDYVAAFLATEPDRNQSLKYQLSQFLKTKKSVPIDSASFDDSSLPAHLRANIKVIGPNKNIVAEGADIESIVQQCQTDFQTTIDNIVSDPASNKQYQDWSFGELEAERSLLENGVKVRVFPGIVDCGDSVRLQYFGHQFSAHRHTERGLLRLFLLAQPNQVRYVKRHYELPESSQIFYSTFGNSKQLIANFVEQVFYQAFVFDDVEVRSSAQFQQRLQQGNGRLATAAKQVQELLIEVLTQYHTISKRLNADKSPATAATKTDIKHQLQQLFPERWLGLTAFNRLQQYPRYLKGILVRLDRLQGKVERDQELANEIGELWGQYTEQKARHQAAGIVDEALENWRWALEEYRISVFAQGMKTAFPISTKRLAKLWQQVA